MSTNFYIRTEYTDGRGGVVTEDQHIGKRSGGWVFHFQGGVNKTVEQWKTATASIEANQQIVDEYDQPMTHEEFWKEVEATTKPWGEKRITPKTMVGNGSWVNKGFSFYDGVFF